jgi:WD40 repeat protein
VEVPFDLSPLVFAPENDENIELLAELKSSTTGKIDDIAWRPGGEEIAVIGALNVVLMDSGTWETIWEIPYGSKNPQLMFSADGALLVVQDGMGYASFVDVESGEMIDELPMEGHFAISPDGSTVASTLGGAIRLLDWQTGEELGFLEGDYDLGAIYDMAFSADGKTVIAGTDHGEVQVWQVGNNQPIFTSPSRIPSEVYICNINGGMYGEPHGNLIVDCSYPVSYSTYYYRVSLWDANNYQSKYIVFREEADEGYYQFVISASRKKLAMFYEDNIEVWNAANGNLLISLSGAAGDGLTFNPEMDNELAVWEGGAIQVWDVNSGELTKTFGENRSIAPVSALAFSPQAPGRTLAVGRSDGVVEIWDTVSGERVTILTEQKGGVTGMAYKTDGSRLVVGSQNDGITIWGTRDEPLLLSTIKPDEDTYALALHPDGATLFTGGDSGYVYQWDLDTVQRASQWSTGSQQITSLVISPDGSLLAAGDSKGVVRLWDIEGRKTLHRLDLETNEAVDAIVFNPDGQQVVTASGNRAMVWDVAIGAWVRGWRSEGRGEKLIYSADQCILGFGSGSSVDLFNTSTERFLSSLSNKAKVTSLGFSTDGYLLAVGGDNGSVRIWGVPGGLDAPTPEESIPVRCPPIQPLPTPTPTEVPTGTPVPSPTGTASPTPVMSPTFTPTPPTFERTLYLTDPHMQGDDVLRVQERLLELGYSEVGTPDGDFGDLTDGAVRHFQEVNGLEVDGVVGPATWEVLFSPEAIESPQ